MDEEPEVTPEGSDVNEDTSEATEGASSGAEQTVEADDQSTDTVDTTATETVPYTRFSEKNEEAKYWKERATKFEQDAQASQTATPTPTAQPSASDQAVKNQLKGLGFITKEEQEAELVRRDDDAKVREQLVRLEGKYGGKDGRPKFNRDKVINHALDNKISNLEMAYKDLHEKKLMDWHVKQALTKTKGTKAEKSDGSGSGQAGTTSQDLRSAIREGDKGALRTYLKRFAPRFDE